MNHRYPPEAASLHQISQTLERIAGCLELMVAPPPEDDLKLTVSSLLEAEMARYLEEQGMNGEFITTRKRAARQDIAIFVKTICDRLSE